MRVGGDLLLPHMGLGVQVHVGVQVAPSCPGALQGNFCPVGEFEGHAGIVEGVALQLRLEGRAVEAVPIAALGEHGEVHEEVQEVQRHRQCDEPNGPRNKVAEHVPLGTHKIMSQIWPQLFKR